MKNIQTKEKYFEPTTGFNTKIESCFEKQWKCCGQKEVF
jgi:hypothetical protein